MCLDKIAIVTLGLFLSTTWAKPSVEILQSCKNKLAANKHIVMKKLRAVGYKADSTSNCKVQFENVFDEKLYGWGVCDNKPYLMVANNKILLSKANDYSINPSVKPGVPIIQTASWWRLDSEDKSYLCIISPLSDSGETANFFQYYIVENAFEYKKNDYPVNFYFFDKEVQNIF